MRGLLNSFTTFTIILMFVGGFVAVALIGVFLARILIPNLADGPWDDVVDGLRVVYELVFSLILAFVIGSVLGNFAAADATVAAEAGTLSHISRANQALPVEQAAKLNEGLSQYVHAVVETEFETMKKGEASPRASAALETMYSLYQTYSPPPADGPEAEFYSQAVDQLREAGAARRDRLALSAAELPSLLRIVLPVGVLFLLVLEYRPKLPLRSQLVHIGLLTMVVSFCYLLTIVLDYPFAGDVSVGTDPYKSGSLAEFFASDTPHEIAKGEKQRPFAPGEMDGVWNSDTFGVMDIRQVGNEVRAVYRAGLGTVAGQLGTDGVFRGWWCEAPTRQPPGDAGDVQWRMTRTPEGDIAFGSWRFGTAEPLRGGWDLVKVGGPEPPDLAPRFDDPSTFCRHP